MAFWSECRKYMELVGVCVDFGLDFLIFAGFGYLFGCIWDYSARFCTCVRILVEFGYKL